MAAEEPIDLYDRSLYINRELSWLKFNERCLDEAEDIDNPLLERVKFLAIAYGNMDEFFMIRVPGTLLTRSEGIPAHMEPDAYGDRGALIAAIDAAVLRLVNGYDTCWTHLNRDLRDNGIRILAADELDPGQREWADRYYRERVHDLLTPLALDVAAPFPFISNNSLNLAVRIDRDGEELHARLKVPTGLLPRFVRLPSSDGTADFILLEDIIRINAGSLFPGSRVVDSYKFRVTRNADVKVTIDEACDLMSAVETSLDRRSTGFPVRIMVEADMPDRMLALFVQNLALAARQVHRVSVGGMMLTDLWEIARLDIPELSAPPFTPYCPPGFGEGDCIFDTIRGRDRILFHPYESFAGVVNLLRQAADDPDVLGIKISLYRIGGDPSVTDALIRARENGKEVSVLLELRAKFDEADNIRSTRELEAADVHVVHGPVDLKVHAKLMQIVRLEDGRLVKYTHMGSGNYNPDTAGQYGDISYFTADDEIGHDVGELFNALTGFFGPRDYSCLMVAPLTLKSELLRKIRREADNSRAGRPAHIAMKANGLVDPDIIAELYRASRAGVAIDLSIRGLCCLRPGIPGVSDNIRVTSVIDRFLEHTRIYCFCNDGDPEMYLGSSDMMPRNLRARVEVLCPVLDPRLMRSIREHILDIHLRDNVKARVLTADGDYLRQEPAPGEQRLRSQQWFVENRGAWNGYD